MWHFDGRTWRTVVIFRRKSAQHISSTYITRLVSDYMQNTTTVPIAIKVKKAKDDANYIGTCRSYDEKQPVPSFVRSLTPDSEKKKSSTGRKRLVSE